MNALKINAITLKINFAKKLELQNALPDFDISDFSVVADEQIKVNDADSLESQRKATNAIQAIKTLGLNPSLKNAVNDAAWDAACYANLSHVDAANYAKSFI